MTITNYNLMRNTRPELLAGSIYIKAQYFFANHQKKQQKKLKIYIVTLHTFHIE